MIASSEWTKDLSQLPALIIPERPSPQKTNDDNNGQMVRRVHEDPERHGSTCTPFDAIDNKDVDD